MSKKSIKPLLVLGSMAAGALIYGSCSKGKKKKNGKKIKKLVSQEIEFIKNASDFDKANVINETERKIVESIYKQEWPGLIIKSFRFSVTLIDENHVHICAKIVMVYLKEGSKPKDPKKDPPVS